jgi:hypothetical protein
MAESDRDPKTSKAEAEKKQPETVLLSAEELRAISGGLTGGVGSPTPNPKITTT